MQKEITREETNVERSIRRSMLVSSCFVVFCE